jgi:anti-sigma-K factor RskA
MTDTRDHIDPPDDDTLAAEYVLGVLPAAERAAVERRMAREAGFASLVSSWERRLVPWTDEIAPVQPPHDVWNRISAALPAQRAEKPGLWQSLALWRWMTVATGALAAACLAALIVFVSQPTQAPLIAAIQANGQSHFVATIDPSRNTVSVVPAAYSADASRVPELWLIAPGDRPRSLGLLQADTTVSLPIPENLRALATRQATLAVSLEPPGGSRTGSPTGPVIATGKLTSL